MNAWIAAIAATLGIKRPEPKESKAHDVVVEKILVELEKSPTHKFTRLPSEHITRPERSSSITVIDDDSGRVRYCPHTAFGDEEDEKD
jgi:hypothetical protein